MGLTAWGRGVTVSTRSEFGELIPRGISSVVLVLALLELISQLRAAAAPGS